MRAAVKPNEDIFLRAGYSANADIILDKRAGVIAIKERDVTFEEEKTFIEVKVGEREFERKQVDLGLSDGIQVEVVSGVDTTTQVRVKRPS